MTDSLPRVVTPYASFLEYQDRRRPNVIPTETPGATSPIRTMKHTTRDAPKCGGRPSSASAATMSTIAGAKATHRWSVSHLAGRRRDVGGDRRGRARRAPARGRVRVHRLRRRDVPRRDRQPLSTDGDELSGRRQVGRPGGRSRDIAGHCNAAWCRTHRANGVPRPTRLGSFCRGYDLRRGLQPGSRVSG